MKTNKIYLERTSEYAITPIKSTDHSACYDLFACLRDRVVKVFDNKNEEQEVKVSILNSLYIYPNERILIPTGFKMACPEDMSIHIYARSGLSAKKGLVIAGSVGIIDPDYRGEVYITLHNISDTPLMISHGDRLAQMMLQKINSIEFSVGELPAINSNRVGGFGSTGV